MWNVAFMEVSMELKGQLRDDIESGNAVLFLGAGASQAAGYKGAVGLSNFLFEKANSPEKYETFKDDLSRLVARLDKDPFFSRSWVNKKLVSYFLDNSERIDLTYHQGLLGFNWKAIFTTNYDMCIENADARIMDKKYRVLSIVDPSESAAVCSVEKGKLKYFKIHGCCKHIEASPTTDSQLVITRADFRRSIQRNKPFMEELKRYAYSGSVIFLGFQAHRTENDFINSYIISAYNQIANSFNQPFKAFVVLKNPSKDVAEDIEDAGLTLLKGTFQEFVDSIIELKEEGGKSAQGKILSKTISVKSSKKNVDFTVGDYYDYLKQFSFLYDGYYDECLDNYNILSNDEVISFWKSKPDNRILSKGLYIKRTNYDKILTILEDQIDKISRKRTSRIFIIKGKRACGKSVFALQLSKDLYERKNGPIISLNSHASYENPKNGDDTSLTPGWNVRQIDKFFSQFVHDDPHAPNMVPIIFSDHSSHRSGMLDYLLSYLDEHEKPCLLITVLNEEEYESAMKPDSTDRLLHLYTLIKYDLDHRLNDEEIEELFNVVSVLSPKILDYRSRLLGYAKDPNINNRDILLILYNWFDKNFRRLDEIIADEIEKLKNNKKLQKFYLSVAVFHQYNFSPHVSVIAESLDLSLDDFDSFRNEPLFKSFFNITLEDDESNESASTRHSEFSRRIVNELIPDLDDRVNLICDVLKVCNSRSLMLVRELFTYFCRYKAHFTVDQMSRIKEATEVYLKNDFVLNHQYGAYLIRERENLEDARYYLDLALEVDETNSSVIHSLGNLCFHFAKKAIEVNDRENALIYFEDAKYYFSKARTLSSYKEEHAYFTDIEMRRALSEKIFGMSNSDDKIAEYHAMTFEALKVVPYERQNYLRSLVPQKKSFSELEEKQQSFVLKEIDGGNASPILLEYYAQHLMQKLNKKNWRRLKELTDSYWDKAIKDPSYAVTLCMITKMSFIKNSKTRFEILRRYFDNIVKHKESILSSYLLSNYIRLVQIDAFVLGKFGFLSSSMPEVLEIYQDYKPKFMGDEYILKNDFYYFDENDVEKCVELAKLNNYDGQDSNWERFNRLVDLDRFRNRKYIHIEIDPISKFYIRGLRMGTTLYGNAELNFCIVHGYDGFKATKFRS